jgi:hypothetical protein
MKKLWTLGIAAIALFVVAVAAYSAESEKEVPLNKVPAAVRATLEKQAKGGKIEEIEAITKDGKTIYEAVIEKGGKTTELKISTDGKVLDREVSDKEDEAAEKAESKHAKAKKADAKEEEEDEAAEKAESKHAKAKKADAKEEEEEEDEDAEKAESKPAKAKKADAKEEEEDEAAEKAESKHAKAKKADAKEEEEDEAAEKAESKPVKAKKADAKEEEEDEAAEKAESKPATGKTTESAHSTFSTEFKVDKANLASEGKNAYFILEPGYTLHFKSGKSTLVVKVTAKTKLVDGVKTRVVEEWEGTEGKPIEISQNYFAIDKKTKAVYYFGEDVDMYKDGKVVNHEGSWLSGVAGAKFGMMMPGKVKVGDKFYQEIAPKTAMDRCEIVALDKKVNTPAGTFGNCLQTKETSPLEAGTSEKIYAPGVGLVKDDEFELVKITGKESPRKSNEEKSK